MKSIARQLAVVTISLIGVVILASGVGLYFGLRSALHTQFDRALHAKAMAVLGQVSWDAEGIEFEPAWEIMPGFVGGDEAEYFRVTVAPDTEVARSPSLRESQSLFMPEMGDAEFVTWDAPLPDGRDGRGMTMRFTLEFDDEDDEGEVNDVPPELFVPDEFVRGVLTVAAGRQPLARPLAVMVAGLFIVGAVLALLIPFVVTMAVRVGLRPVRHLNEQMEAIDEHHLDDRLDFAEMPIELRASVDRMNAMLARLSEAFAREKRFAAGAAHELRTPLAEMRTVAEVALRTDHPTTASHAALTEVVAAAEEMETLLEGLLRIARGEARKDGAAHESVDVASLVRESAARHEPGARARQVDFALSIESERWASGERALIAAIIDNLMANASRYAPSGSTVDVRVAASPGAVHIEFTNDAPDLTPDDLPRLFEPLWRQDASRTARGTGLGLTVARTLARQVNGDIVARLDPTTSELTLSVSLVPVA